jgi:hypothetical protein
VLALAVAGAAVDHHQRHGSAKAHAPPPIRFPNTRGRPNASARASRFESPQLHQEVCANRLDFPGSETTRHFRNLCAENRSCGRFGTFRRSFSATSHQSLWPQISVSRVALLQELAQRDRKWPLGATSARREPIKGLIGRSTKLPDGLKLRPAGTGCRTAEVCGSNRWKRPWFPWSEMPLPPSPN